MSWSSRIPDLLAAIPDIVDAAGIAAQAVQADAVREKLRGGYTSGDYVTGANLESVITLEPVTEGGMRVFRTTTRLTDPPYPWFWEVGFFSGHIRLDGAPEASSVRTRSPGHFIRVEKWRPAAEESAAAAEAAFDETASAAFAAHLGGLA